MNVYKNKIYKIFDNFCVKIMKMQIIFIKYLG